MEWSFTLCLQHPLTREQADQFDHCDALADGAISYTLAPEAPDAHPLVADSTALRELACDIEAPDLLDAVAEAVRRIRLVDGLRAVGVTQPDTVTREEAAQRSGTDAEALRGLAGQSGFPPPVTDEGTVLYSWSQVAGHLRERGVRVADVPRDLVIADRALRLAEALDGADVPWGALRALGLPAES
ncbi:hypothetical protein [Streptomyces sp. NPDC005438]|uniref:hypothetical protein n=1 Tax=Streptomyces sp. NPDC005438 TaxID=3156880 RepID=UPI0033BADB5F